MFATTICIRPIGTDLVAVSAFDTFVRKMGYEGLLLSLCREELWILHFDLDDGKTGELTEMLVNKTGIFVNPNTHTNVVVRPHEMLPHGRRSGREDLAIAVWSLEDPQIEPVTVAVKERMGIQNLKALKRLILWWPHLAEGVGGEEYTGSATTKREIASSMVPTYSRKQGLLTNPHYQSWHIVERGVTPHELMRTLLEIEKNGSVRTGIKL